MKNNAEKWAYIAGYLDGNGCIDGKIIRDKTLKRKWKILLSISFIQNLNRKWFIEQLYNDINMGYILDRSDKNLELIIKSKNQIKDLIKKLQPYLKLKKAQANLMIEILNKNIETDEEFIEVCKMIDKFGYLNESKNIKYTSIIVEKELLKKYLPVETEN